MKLYQEELMDHYRHPQNKGHLYNPDFFSHEHNPSCGDAITMEGNVVNMRLVEIAFEGKGCVISQAAASMLTTLSKGKSITEILGFDANTMRSLIGIDLGPMRLKCALLALQALQQGIATYMQKGK